MLRKIREYYAKKRILKLLSDNERKGFVEIKSTQSILLLINSNQYKLGTELDKLSKLIKSAFPKLSHFNIIAYTSVKEKLYTPELKAFHDKNENFLLNTRRLGFAYKLPKLALQKIENEAKYDVIMHFDRQQDVFAQRILASIKSEFNIGYQNDANIELYDFMIKSDIGLEALGKEIIRYIQLINDES